MVTKYDIFEFVYKYRHPIKPIEVLEKFKKRRNEYNNIHKMLTFLVNEDLILKNNYGYQIKKSDKSNLLYQIIFHCLKNNLSYNQLLNPSFVKFLSIAFQKNEITSSNIKLNPLIFRKYIEILRDNQLLLVISEKPYQIKIFFNILLNNILVYYGYNHKVIINDSNSYLKNINKELSKFNRLKREKNIKYQEIIEDLEIYFIHHSLSLEGNPITLSETKRILKDDILPSNLRTKDVDEVRNYQKAYKQMLRDSIDKKPLTLQIILEYHNIAMQHAPEIAGKIRKIGVFIQGNMNFKITKKENIEDELDKLISEYNEFIIRKGVQINEIINFATYLHNEFQHIHPFEDGNSRTTRLITFHLLQSKDIPIFDIPYGLLDEYLSYTKGSKIRDDKHLYYHFQKIILWNLKKINKEFQS